MGRLYASGTYDTGTYKGGTFNGTYVPNFLESEDRAMALVDFVTLGDNLSFTIQTSDAVGVPADADAVPTYKIMSADLQSTLLTGNTAKLAGETGIYYLTKQINASDGFAAGKTYSVLVSWAVASSNRQRQYSFKVN